MAGVLLVSAAVLFAVVYVETGARLEHQIEHDITADTSQLAQALRPVRATTPAQAAASASRYVSAQPYSATSTLLFVLVPGKAPSTNHPEVFGRLAGERGEEAADQSRENQIALRLRTPRLGYSTQSAPDAGRMRLLEQPFAVGRIPVVIGAGEPLAIVERAQHGIARAFALAGALTFALALAASYLAGERVTAPLRRLASVAARVDAGELEPRMEVSPRQGDEVKVLAESFNHMLDRLSEAFASQREFVADASHELRTPLTVIRGQLEVLAAQEHVSSEEVRRTEALVQAEITRISRLVDDLLVLAQAERTDFLREETIDVRPFVADLWDGLSLTAERRFERGPVPAGSVQADPDRLAQALRNLGRNAVEHTREGTGLVRLEVARAAHDAIRFTVIDNGPGISPGQRDRVFERFHRTDTSRSRSGGGAGLGLAIVRTIAEAHGGSARAVEPRAGRGAQIELVLPGFRVAQERAEHRYASPR